MVASRYELAAPYHKAHVVTSALPLFYVTFNSANCQNTFALDDPKSVSSKLAKR
jgi:hypothetical protein